MSTSRIRSKAYTLNRLITEISALNTNKINNVNALANYLSPARGSFSVKFQVLNSFLNGGLKRVAVSNKYGTTVKQRVLRALKARKRYGSDFSSFIG